MNDVYTPAPIARRMAQNGPLGPQLHAADVVAEVRANPSGKSTDELIAELQPRGRGTRQRERTTRHR